MKTVSILLFIFIQFYCPMAQTVINAGIGGNTTDDLLERLDSDVIDQHPDLVLLMVGTNDFLNSDRMIPYDTYKKNLLQILDRLKEHQIEVVLMSSPTVDSIYLFDRHDPSRYKEFPNVKMEKASRIMESIALEYALGFIDLNQAFRSAGIPVHNEDDFLQNVSNSGRKDGVHPTRKGYAFMVDIIYDYLVTYDYLKKYHRILCFGDSITNGANVEGSGTTEGDTYPAQLLRKLK